jgi:hypothetical protein
MIAFDTQIKLQAFLDGELPEQEAMEIAALIARDPEAAALHLELKNTRRALNGAEPTRSVPESREFYWSKIQREIERTEPAERPEKKAEGVPLGRWLLRWLIPTGAVAAILVGMLTMRQKGIPVPGISIQDSGGPEMVTSLADSEAITFCDENNGVTLVWFSYPAEKDVADDQSTDTLD